MTEALIYSTKPRNRSLSVQQVTLSLNIPVVKVPSGMKKAPTVMPTSIRNLKNQNLRRQK